MMKKIHILQGSSISKMFLLTATACLLVGGVDAQSRLKAPGKVVKAEKAKAKEVKASAKAKKAPAKATAKKAPAKKATKK